MGTACDRHRARGRRWSCQSLRFTWMRKSGVWRRGAGRSRREVYCTLITNYDDYRPADWGEPTSQHRTHRCEHKPFASVDIGTLCFLTRWLVLYSYRRGAGDEHFGNPGLRRVVKNALVRLGISRESL
ncbi:MAG: hypothetical protein KatS3mg111_0748 [Pirellulaceae bacterium]|nr:MAG: hypothetical protein KatS3mg111_0748 [Pirellulaceae bacterium]